MCCRCSPTQKADIVRLIQSTTQKETWYVSMITMRCRIVITDTCCSGVGDGGNDVGMIQAANVGIGLVGKEGKQVL